MLIQRTCTWRGNTLETWWRELTAGQQNELLSGSTLRHEGEAKLERSVMEVDLQLNDTQQKKLVAFTCCTEDGKPMYASLQKLMAESASKVKALATIAEEVRKLFESGEVGNA